MQYMNGYEGRGGYGMQFPLPTASNLLTCKSYLLLFIKNDAIKNIE